MVAGPGMRPAPRSVVDGLTLPKAGADLVLNPLYRRDETGGYAIAWPSERYEAEYAPHVTYPLRSDGPERLVFSGGIEAAEIGRVRSREFVDLPERW
nr:hypothetical protein [Methylobacterium sp. WL116]